MLIAGYLHASNRENSLVRRTLMTRLAHASELVSLQLGSLLMVCGYTLLHMDEAALEECGVEILRLLIPFTLSNFGQTRLVHILCLFIIPDNMTLQCRRCI